MSTNLAYARPQQARPAPSPVREVHPRHIEIVTTRAQRRARPKVAYALVTVASLFLIFAAQLLLSIVVSDGAYQIQNLQSQQKELLRTQQSLSEQLDLLGSSQHLAASAANLGMVPNQSPLILNLGTGAVAGAPGTFDHTGCGGSCNLVANALLEGMPLVEPGSAEPAQDAGATSGSQSSGNSQTTTDDGALPAPVTH
jgi:hypothetical protein